MNRSILITAAFIGALAIGLGAFGAHGLKSLVSAEMVLTFETGVRYQMYHALFLLFLGSNTLLNAAAKKRILIFTIVGLILFSGSIYGLSTMEISQINFKKIGFVTPIGGLCLIIAWVLAALSFLKAKRDNS